MCIYLLGDYFCAFIISYISGEFGISYAMPGYPAHGHLPGHMQAYPNMTMTTAAMAATSTSSQLPQQQALLPRAGATVAVAAPTGVVPQTAAATLVNPGVQGAGTNAGTSMKGGGGGGERERERERERV